MLVTGGLGFIGSNLARRLVALGADVVIADAMIAGTGGHPFNVSGLQEALRVVNADLRDDAAMSDLVAGQEIIFNLAGQVSHIDSMRDPLGDLEINCHAHLALLECCRQHNTAVKIVFAGTRQVYGRAETLPVTEKHVVRPVDVNGINKAAAEYDHLVYNDAFGIRACSLRLTNIYGPRQLIAHDRQGFIGWFIGLAVQDADITIFGDGDQVRDFVYVDDAIDAFLRAGASDGCNGRVFNVGGAEPTAIRDVAELLVRVAGTGRTRHVPWPSDRRNIDIGSIYADFSRLSDETGWRPRVLLRDGLTRTVAFYRAHLDMYSKVLGADGGPA